MIMDNALIICDLELNIESVPLGVSGTLGTIKASQVVGLRKKAII